MGKSFQWYHHQMGARWKQTWRTTLLQRPIQTNFKIHWYRRSWNNKNKRIWRYHKQLQSQKNKLGSNNLTQEKQPSHEIVKMVNEDKQPSSRITQKMSILLKK